MNTAAAINAYKNVDLETSVLTADPHKLVTMLYDGALLAISRAREEILNKEIAAKGQSISKAIAIIGEGLNACLDKESGGDLAIQLSELYSYMTRRLVEANLHNDVSALDEVGRLLGDIKGAWDSIRPQVLEAKGYPSATSSMDT